MSQSFISASTVTIGGTTFDPISFDVTQDNSWTPLWQGTIVLPAAGAPAIDPKTWPRINLKWWFGTHDQASPPLVLDYDFIVRAYVRDWVNDTVTLSVSSGEVMLQDYRNAGADYQPGIISLKAMVDYAMGKVGATIGTGSGPTYYDTSPLPNVNIPAQATIWKAGQTLDDWLRGALRSQGFEIFETCVLATRPEITFYDIANGIGKAGRIGGDVNAVYGQNVIEMRSGFDMDSTGWADAAVVEYNWTTAAGAVQRKIYAKTPAGAFHRVEYVQLQSADPGFDPAPSVLAMAAAAAATAEIATYPTPTTWLSNQLVPPAVGDFLHYQDASATTYDTTVTRVQYSYPADRITWGLSAAQARGSALPPNILPVP